MGYINAKSVLPKEMMEEIQKYVNGVNLYIPKLPETNSICSSYKLELDRRNREIYELMGFWLRGRR